MSGGTDVTTRTRRAPGTAPGTPGARAPAPGGQRRSPAGRPAPGTRPAQGTRSAAGGRARGGGTRLGPAAADARVRPGRPTVSPPLPAGGAAAPAAVPFSRTPFVFLIVGLLGGGLLCLLLVNTILDTGSFQITRLQQDNISLAQRTQALQAQIAAEESPSLLAARASQFGMREPGLLHFLDLKTGRIDSQPSHMPDVRVVPPGYSP
ncbi:MAG TPA: hypothetical protein DHU96_19960 [Actinobacteria bacterium]|nr:hypothetical protein [Actinomycetota bacterium]